MEISIQTPDDLPPIKFTIQKEELRRLLTFIKNGDACIDFESKADREQGKKVTKTT